MYETASTTAFAVAGPATSVEERVVVGALDVAGLGQELRQLAESRRRQRSQLAAAAVAGQFCRTNVAASLVVAPVAQTPGQ